MERKEPIILRSLITNESYVRRVLPFLDPNYFLDQTERLIFANVKAFIDKYNTLPTSETLLVDMDAGGAAADTMESVSAYLNTVSKIDTAPSVEWLVDTTEEWCQEKAIHNAVVEVINILDGKDKKNDKGVIPKLLQDALGVSFDPHVGHDYLEDSEMRYEFYHRVDTRIPFHLTSFNKVTKNGVPNKTLNICLAGTNVGKSLFMCDLAANYLKQGKNVLYITMEMAEERIAERIDANMMDVPLDELPMMTKDGYQRAIDRINGATAGKLIIKEYPTGAAHSGHFRHLLNELRLKKNFRPDAIFIDYLNICASSRLKASGEMYQMVKSIAEELRGLAVEFDVPIWSATQMNRAGFNNSDPDLTNTSESFGLPATADFMFALVNTDELKGMNQLLVKILKNRYGDVNHRDKATGQIMNKFVVGVDRSKQKLYEDSAMKQDLSADDPMLSAPAVGLRQKMTPGAVSFDIDNDDTPPFDPDPVKDWGGKTAEPQFDIDLPTEERPFKSSEEEAERRRISTKNESVPFRPKQTLGKKNHGINL